VAGNTKSNAIEYASLSLRVSLSALCRQNSRGVLQITFSKRGPATLGPGLMPETSSRPSELTSPDSADNSKIGRIIIIYCTFLSVQAK